MGVLFWVIGVLSLGLFWCWCVLFVDCCGLLGLLEGFGLFDTFHTAD